MLQIFSSSGVSLAPDDGSVPENLKNNVAHRRFYLHVSIDLLEEEEER